MSNQNDTISVFLKSAFFICVGTSSGRSIIHNMPRRKRCRTVSPGLRSDAPSSTYISDAARMSALPLINAIVQGDPGVYHELQNKTIDMSLSMPPTSVASVEANINNKSRFCHCSTRRRLCSTCIRTNGLLLYSVDPNHVSEDELFCISVIKSKPEFPTVRAGVFTHDDTFNFTRALIARLHACSTSYNHRYECTIYVKDVPPLADSGLFALRNVDHLAVCAWLLKQSYWFQCYELPLKKSDSRPYAFHIVYIFDVHSSIPPCTLFEPDMHVQQDELTDIFTTCVQPVQHVSPNYGQDTNGGLDEPWFL